MKRTGFKWKPRKPLKRTRLRVVGTSSTSELKNAIQAKLRALARHRDGGCIMRHYPESGLCGGTNKEGALILQAEHLITRSNSATFADMRNIVCLCQRHHGFFKPQHSRLYWEIIERHLGPQLWNWLKLAEADRTPHKRDWKMELLALESECKKYEVQM